MNFRLFAVALLLAAMPMLAVAHHSFAMFDQNQVVSLKGTVRGFQWTNPHSWLQLEVLNDHGVTEEWSLEMLSPNVLRRFGWKHDSIMPGDVVTAYFNPTRNSTHGGNLVKIARPDGTTIGASR
jgi:hypothetical protein